MKCALELEASYTVARLGVLLRKHDKRESMRLQHTLTLIVSLELSVRITLILGERKLIKRPFSVIVEVLFGVLAQ